MQPSYLAAASNALRAAHLAAAPALHADLRGQVRRTAMRANGVPNYLTPRGTEPI